MAIERLGRETRLADARRTDDQRDTERALSDRAQMLVQGGELALPSDERRSPVRSGG